MDSSKRYMDKRYDAEKSEYFMVRNGIVSMFDRQEKSETTLLSVYALILAYLLSETDVDPISFLVPIPLVIFSYMKRYDMYLNIWKEAAFCIVYGYDYGFMWEKRLYEYRDVDKAAAKHSKEKISRLSLYDCYYYSLCIICIFLFIYKNKLELITSVFGIFISFILLIMFIFRYKFGIYHYSIIFKNEIDKWKSIKYKENI